MTDGAARRGDRLGGDRLEEGLIALILGLMTLVTFANVVARYVFDANILWALEMTSFLFAWLVLLGVSYCVKVTAHLGVDALINMFGPGPRRILALISGAVCIAFALLLLKGSWDYWANFANLPATTGRWFPLGFEENFRGKSWYEVNDIGMPDYLNALVADFLNEGERYEKLPRFIPYAILPFGMALLLWRFIQAFLRIWRGEQDLLIVSHEVDDKVEKPAAGGPRDGD